MGLAVAAKLPGKLELGGDRVDWDTDVTHIAARADRSAALVLEACVLRTLKHPRIVALVGIATQSQPAVLCLEYMANGDLRSFLRKCRPALEVPKAEIGPVTMAAIAARLCSALAFLEAHSIVHS